MEALSKLLKKARVGRFLSSWCVSGDGGKGVEISRLLFADDTLVFYDPSHEQLTYVSWLLMWFEAISGLKVNLDKSELIPTEIVDYAHDLAREFGCKLGSLPSTYLGLPLGAPFRHVAVWDGVEERLHKRLALWKRYYLSKGGRLYLGALFPAFPFISCPYLAS